MSEQQWKLVPLVPTEEMVEHVRNFAGSHGYSMSRGTEAVETWKEMMSVAPQPPALGGELEVIYMLRNTALNTPWRDADKAAFDSAAELVEYERRELVDRAHVNRLQDEVSQLRQHKNDFMEAAEETRKALQAEVERHFEDNAELGRECSRLNRRTAELEGLLRDFKAGGYALTPEIHNRIDTVLAEGKEHE